ncbi:MAG: hypothetical protein KAY22_20145 [Rhizorhabdus sp.]|uniref:hypothetical protein n=1 Tax=Rhizorhabdus sp. TaxID=1968843 RepID=UPI001B72DECB|nr:hypothetical protein [Rhizorhabdus sp.]MBP8234610.1 hypothetical protein [Rhizorhabdus sp.]
MSAAVIAIATFIAVAAPVLFLVLVARKALTVPSVWEADRIERERREECWAAAQWATGERRVGILPPRALDEE